MNIQAEGNRGVLGQEKNDIGFGEGRGSLSMCNMPHVGTE